MNARSTTLRIAALVFVLQLAAAFVLLLGVGAIVRQQSAADAAATAAVLRDDLLASYARGGRRALVDTVELRSSREITPNTVMLVVARDGRRLAGNLVGWPGGLGSDTHSVEVRQVRQGRAQPEAMRVRVSRLSGGERLLTGVIVEQDRRLLHELEAATLVALALAALFAVLAATLTARMIAARLGRTVATLRAVRDGDFVRRVEQHRSGDAFDELAGEVNATLDRVEALLGELTLATDALAHDLKSPLTRLRSALERAAVEVREPAAQEAVDRAVAEGERLLAMVETALRITRAEAGIGRDAFTATDLGDELAQIAEIYGPLAEDFDRAIVVHAPVSATLPVHHELFGQALGNLVDNALKYGAGTITLALAVGPRAITVSVADEGAGIPADRQAEALRRFGRLDEARSAGGSGLGLSLVAAVARLHGGTIRLGDARPGLRVEIDLPTLA
ncbi:HAMP domain-containing sensor histidine kinase [uncultured Sphingomonas sp.]|uniref:sensor histidine kinase n=1 Tax=uncultured Sphingomonas sp. TaxID=158754 RepID=UPI0025CC199F|nr:HAMP domain-containing sensor histidine kinase [uncultured Sphingomonas sp.]